MKWPDKSPKLLNVFKSDSEHERVIYIIVAHKTPMKINSS